MNVETARALKKLDKTFSDMIHAAIAHMCEIRRKLYLIEKEEGLDQSQRDILNEVETNIRDFSAILYTDTDEECE